MDECEPRYHFSHQRSVEMLESPKLSAGILLSSLRYIVYRNVKIFLRIASTLHELQYYALATKHSVNRSECFWGPP